MKPNHPNTESLLKTLILLNFIVHISYNFSFRSVDIGEDWQKVLIVMTNMKADNLSRYVYHNSFNFKKKFQ